MSESCKLRLRNFIESRFSKRRFGDDDSFMEFGIIDSTGILELMQFIETEFAVSVDQSEMMPDNLDSLNRLTAFINKKRNPA